MVKDPTNPNAPDGGPAFPLYLGVYAGTAPPHIVGMSLRDYFAGQVLAGVMVDKSRSNFVAKDDAEYCYKAADAMLEARK